MDDHAHFRDPFLRRLAGGIAAGLALQSAYGAYLYRERIPGIHDVLLDFNVALPIVTRVVLAVPSLTLLLGLATLLVGVLAAKSAHPKFLVVAWVLALLSLGAVVGAELALSYPLTSLLDSVSGR